MWKIAALFGLWGASAIAQTSTETCAVYGGLAAQIMQNRQAGVSLTQIIGMIEEGPDADSYRKIMIEAYEEPRWQGPAMQRRSVEDFRISIELRCIKQLSN